MRASSSSEPPQRTRVTAAVASDRDAVGGEGQIASCGEVAEHLIASIRAGGDHRVGRDLVDQLLQAGRPGGGRVCGELIIVGEVHASRTPYATEFGWASNGRGHAPDRRGRARGKSPAGTAPRPARPGRARVIRPLPISRMISTTRGAASGPVAEDLRLLALARRHHEPQLLQPRRRPLGRGGLDRLRARAQLRRHGRVARQVDPLEHAHDGGQRQVVDVAAAGHLLLAARAAVRRPRGPSARSRSAGRARRPPGCPPGSCPRRPTRCRRRSGRSRRRRTPRPARSRRSPRRWPAGPTPRRP